MYEDTKGKNNQNNIEKEKLTLPESKTYYKGMVIRMKGNWNCLFLIHIEDLMFL